MEAYTTVIAEIVSRVSRYEEIPFKTVVLIDGIKNGKTNMDEISNGVVNILEDSVLVSKNNSKVIFKYEEVYVAITTAYNFEKKIYDYLIQVDENIDCLSYTSDSDED
jgi:hypothetical protein